MAPLSERFEMRLDEDILSRVDRWRVEQDNAPSRAEAMRRLIEIGLMKTTNDAVKFSDGEKLLLIMMRDVYRHLEIEGEIDPDFICEVIFGGHYWAPTWQMTGLFHGHEDNSHDLRLVCDVLEMWEYIERAYGKLSKKEKERVAREAEPFGKSVQFRGFDGNNESSHLSIADFLIEKMKRFSRFKGRDLNAHMPTLARYRCMLDVFAPLPGRLVGAELSVDQVIQVLTAYRHDE